MKAHITLRLSYAEWSRAVDADRIASYRQSIELLEAMLAPAVAELERAALDCLAFGEGFVEINDEGVRHIPIDQVKDIAL